MTQNKRGEQQSTFIKEQLERLHSAIKPGCKIYQASSSTSTHFDTKGEVSFWNEALTELAKYQKNFQTMTYSYLILTADNQTRLFWMTPTGATHIKLDTLDTIRALMKKDGVSCNDIKEELGKPLELDAKISELILDNYYQQNKFTTIQTYQTNKNLGKYNAARAFQADTRKLHDDIAKEVQVRAEKVFQHTVIKLEKLAHQEKVPGLKDKVKQLNGQILALKKEKPESITELTYILEATYQLIDPSQTTDKNSANLKSYQGLAHQTQGAPNPNMRALGITMLMIGSLMLLYGGIILTMAALLPPPTFVLFYIGIAFAAPGAILAPVGIGLFSAGQRRGISKIMEDINNEVSRDLTPAP